ncbi:hypothetical protein LZ31DRAFT_598940 [Colletotrichum somersetense]|nr:hypothetical protein LZ31DRAFT_598940 [Colletotrichum somersetense]
MSGTRRSRLPISCEPCRTRKIRCTRDDPPCLTCVRRGIRPSLCHYKMRNQQPDGGAPTNCSSPPSSSTLPAPSRDVDLTARVAKLERLLEAQIAARESQSLAGSSAATAMGQGINASMRRPINAFGPSTPTRLVGQARPPGKLRTTPSGHVRYIPTSSISGPGEGRDADTECHLFESLEGPFPFGRAGDHEAAACLDALPPSSLCSKVKNIFFESFAPLFHILHDITFHHQYAAFEENPNSTPLAWLALLYAILGTAVTAVEPDSEILAELSRQATVAAKIDELSQRYRIAAMRCLQADNFLWQHNVTTLQTLIILIYGISHSHGQSWSLLGLAHQIALSIGCHVDPSGLALDVIEREERRRCWAGLTMLYTTQNTGLGNLGTSRLFCDHSVLPPADVDDQDLVAGSNEPPRHTVRATQMSYLLLKFRLYEIGSNICTNVLAVQDPSVRTILDLDQAIAAEQQHFRALYISHSRREPLPAHHQAHYHILSGYSHQLLLLLHRPLLRASPHSGNLKESRTRCFESAKSLLDIHAQFHESSDFTAFKW